MRVHELVERYNKNERIDIAKLLEVKKYTSIVFKRKMAELVLDNCTTVVDGEIHIDSVEKYILFTLAVIGMHTNLDFVYEEDDESSATNDYDMLCESGLLVKIIDTFKDDYASCQEVLNMMTADRMQNNMTLEKKLTNFFDEAADMLSGVIEGLVEKLNIDDVAGDLPVNYEKILDIFDSAK